MPLHVRFLCLVQRHAPPHSHAKNTISVSSPGLEMLIKIPPSCVYQSWVCSAEFSGTQDKRAFQKLSPRDAFLGPRPSKNSKDKRSLWAHCLAKECIGCKINQHLHPGLYTQLEKAHHLCWLWPEMQRLRRYKKKEVASLFYLCWNHLPFLKCLSAEKPKIWLSSSGVFQTQNRLCSGWSEDGFNLQMRVRIHLKWSDWIAPSPRSLSLCGGGVVLETAQQEEEGIGVNAGVHSSILPAHD